MLSSFSQSTVGDKSVTASYFEIPVITTIGYPGDDQAADPAGGQVITLTGSGFLSAPSIYIGTTQASIVSFVNSTTVTFISPANTAGTYTILLVNSDGASAAAVPGIIYSGTPTWTTSSGSLATVYESLSINSTVNATGDGSIVYSLYSGTLPPGSSLNTSTGAITGTSPLLNVQTTYSFVIRATDAQLQDTDRSFSITINPDVVTWSSPADGSTSYLLNGASSSTALSASSAAGKSISYSGDVLPTGLSVSGSNIVGTPTVDGNTTSIVTATAATTGKTATRTFNWVVYTNDPYFNQTTMLLQADIGDTFATDASTNDFLVTVSGNAGATPFTPFADGYYSSYFNGDEYLTTSNGAALSGDFTIECWFNRLSNTDQMLCGNFANNNYVSVTSTSIIVNIAGTSATFTVGISGGQWYHVAITRVSNVFRCWVNGAEISGSNTTLSGTLFTGAMYIGIYKPSPYYYWKGYISNFRIVNGSAVYTSNFIPSTTPLTAISGTSLLTCQSNKLIDNSSNNYTIAAVGNGSIKPATPFTVPSILNGQGSGIFNGGTDSVKVVNASTNLTLSGDFTLEYWMYPTSYTGFGTTFSNVPAYGTTSTLVGQFANNTNTFGFYIGQAVTPALTHIIPRFQWTHHAIVRSGSTVTIYRNGTSLGTITTSSTLNANSLALGGYTDGTNPFYGYISNARLVKGTALYTGTFTPSTTPLTAVANTSLLTLQTSISASNNAFVDSSQANQLVTRAGTVTQGTFTPYGSNWSNYFDGTGDYLTLASNAALAMGTGDFTFESWIYPLSWTNTTNPMIISGASAALQVGKNNATGGFGVASFGLSWIISNATLPTLNTWTHVAVTRSGTTLKMFLNGVQSGSTATDTTNFTSILYVGNNADYFNGYISNLRLVKGTALYTSTFTPSTTPLTAVSGTSLLTCQSNRIIDNSSNTFAITKNGDVTVVRASPFGTGSTNAVYSNTSVTGGSIYYQTTTTDYLSIPTSENFNLSGDFSIECWVYPTAQLATDWGIIDARVSAGSATSWIWSLRTVSGVYKLSFYTGAFSTGTNAIPLNAWTHVAITRSGSSVKFFVNGVVDGTTTLSNAFNAGANPVYIGSKDLATAGYGTQGYISDLRIIKGAATYTSAFTPPTAPLTTTASTTLALKFTNSGINDNMGLSDLIASGNSQVVTSTEKYGTGSMYFDGTGDYLTAPNSGAFSFGTGNFTIEGWVYMTSYVSSGACLLGTVNGATSGYYVNLGSNINSFRVTSNASGSWADNITCSTGNGIPLNEWVHVAFVRNGANITLYKNGVSVATSSSAIAYNYSSPNNAGYVGYVNNGSSTQYFPGYIDDLRVTKGIARYTSNFTPPGLLPAR